jgi:hypothetical protein
MAQKDMNDYTGRIGKLVFYRWKNKKCIRTIPSRVRQTEATKRMAGLFGKASAIGRLLRKSLADVLPDPKETRMRLRFCNAIYQWLRSLQPGDPSTNLPFINRFSFSERSLPNNLVKKLNVEWLNDKVKITIPALDLAADLPAPKGAKSVELKFVLVGCDIENLLPVQAKSEAIEFDYESSISVESSIPFDIPIKHRMLFIVVLAMKYHILSEGEIGINEILKWRAVGVANTKFI